MMTPRRNEHNSSQPNYPYASSSSQFPSPHNPHFFPNPPTPNYFRKNPINNRHDEEALRAEVIYLHSLWHQGPPRSDSSSTPYSNSNSNSDTKIPKLTSKYPTLKPSSSKPFKKKKKKSEPAVVSEKEWPVVTPVSAIPSASGSGWPEFKSCSIPKTRPASADEVASLVATSAQREGIRTVGEFFKKDEDGDDEEEEDEEEDGDGGGLEESQEFGFLLKLFEGDDELRGYYEKCNQNGEFYCLVCSGISHKSGRKFPNCVSLVNHSVSIMKTKKRKAHRVYGHVICRLLGWDINRLPAADMVVHSDPPQASLKVDDCIGNEDLGGNKQGAPVSNAEAAPSVILPSASGPGWLESKSSSIPKTQPASAGEVSSLAATTAQREGIQTVREFFKKDEEGDDDKDGEEDGDGGGLEGRREFGFLLKLFEGDNELRGYYEKCNKNGEFYCLVCSGISHKSGRKFPNCVSLVKHSVSIMKTKKRKAHRVYGHVICKLLGWDINQLPAADMGVHSDPTQASLKVDDSIGNEDFEGNRQ